MHIRCIVYLGIKTEKFHELSRFFGSTLGLPQDHKEPGFETFLLPDGEKIEIYGTDEPPEKHDFYTTGPVVGFEVDDIEEAKKELEQSGVEFLTQIQGNSSRWAHFRGPDGNVYEIKQVS